MSEIVSGMKVLACAECGVESDDVRHSAVAWWPWGHNAFHCAWEKHEGGIDLCETCAGNDYDVCGECGAIMPVEYSGMGYTSPEGDEEAPWTWSHMCPECAIESGAHVDIRPAPPRVAGVAAARA